MEYFENSLNNEVETKDTEDIEATIKNSYTESNLDQENIENDNEEPDHTEIKKEDTSIKKKRATKPSLI